MTDFDLVAPIAIYHFADVGFKAKAQCALKRIKRSHKGLLADLDGASLDETGDLARVYRQLFEYIVDAWAPHWTKYRDQYGALGFKNSLGQVVFTGDDNNQYPWYETEKLLGLRIGRGLADEANEIAKREGY